MIATLDFVIVVLILNWEHLIRDKADFNRYIEYLHWNPVKHRYVVQVSKEEEIEARNREADDAWVAYQRSGQFGSNEAVMAWLDTSRIRTAQLGVSQWTAS